MTSRLEVTQEALLYLYRTLQERQAPDNVAMRLSRSPAGLEVQPDQERLGDRGFDFEDRTVLLIDQTLVEALDGQRLGILKTPQGEAQLHLVQM